MIVVLNKGIDYEKVLQLKDRLMNFGLEIHESKNMENVVWELVGNTSIIDTDYILADEAVKFVKRLQVPYRLVSRKKNQPDSTIDIEGRKIGGGNFQIIAGPCSIENETQIIGVAIDVKNSGVGLLRGGAFKPRTSPYSFQGLKNDGLRLLLKAKEATGLPVVTEIMTPEHISLFDEVDIIQIGARNMQNFELLKAVGKTDKTILLKRGLASTLDEFLMSAEYIMSAGNNKVILCERGIRTFETATRNTLDISAIPLLKKMTHLPVIVDPSHASGIRFLVEPLALAAIAAGADGVMIEVHNDPKKALCDGPQSMTLEGFKRLVPKIKKTAIFFGKTIQ